MQSSARIGGLDGIRAIAIALVFASHLYDGLPLPGADMGVHIFFALSGYLITGILLREHRDTGRIDFRAFYVRRWLRLEPAFAVVIVASLVLALAWGYSHAWWDALTAATYTTNLYDMVVGQHLNTIGHAWSLATEEQFYLLWPPILGAFFLARDRNAIPATVLATVGGVIVSAVLYPLVSHNAVYLAPTTSLPPLMIGAAAAVLLDRGLPLWAVRALRSWVAPAGGIVVLALLLHYPMWSWPWSYRGGWALVGAATAVIALHVTLAQDSHVSRALSIRPVAWVGRRSYGLYLWHLPALGLATRIAWHSRVLTVAMSVVLAAVSWRLVETPALRLKRRFERASFDDLARPSVRVDAGELELAGSR